MQLVLQCCGDCLVLSDVCACTNPASSKFLDRHPLHKGIFDFMEYLNPNNKPTGALGKLAAKR